LQIYDCSIEQQSKTKEGGKKKKNSDEFRRLIFWPLETLNLSHNCLSGDSLAEILSPRFGLIHEELESLKLVECGLN
jgi:hypothetical protein